MIQRNAYDKTDTPGEGEEVAELTMEEKQKQTEELERIAMLREKLKSHEFQYLFYDLYTGIEKEIKEKLYTIAEDIDVSVLKGPLYSMAHEMAVNGLKAQYKRVYYKYFLQEIGLDYVPYAEWLALFKTEIESHQAENFARLCREKELAVTVTGSLKDDIFSLEVVNEGVPTEIEFTRLEQIISKARNKKGAAYIFDDDDDDEEDEQKEGGGLGITLIILSLRNLGIDPNNFKVFAEKDTTIARLELPLVSLKSPI